MSRRGRALGFGLAAAISAVGAAAIADGYGSRVAGGYGALRPVVVAAAGLRPGAPVDSVAVEGLEVRRVPARFVPPGALRIPAQALGLVPAAAIPAGAYVLAAQLRPPRSGDPLGSRLGGGRRPVQITVSGVEALSVANSRPEGTKVDVIVTAEPSSSGAGRTYVAAVAVPLLALAPATEGGAGGTAAATLGLTRRQALRLIAAESFARQLTVLPAG